MTTIWVQFCGCQLLRKIQDSKPSQYHTVAFSATMQHRVCFAELDCIEVLNLHGFCLPGIKIYGIRFHIRFISTISHHFPTTPPSSCIVSGNHTIMVSMDRLGSVKSPWFLLTMYRKYGIRFHVRFISTWIVLKVLNLHGFCSPGIKSMASGFM